MFVHSKQIPPYQTPNPYAGGTTIIIIRTLTLLLPVPLPLRLRLRLRLREWILPSPRTHTRIPFYPMPSLDLSKLPTSSPHATGATHVKKQREQLWHETIKCAPR